MQQNHNRDSTQKTSGEKFEENHKSKIITSRREQPFYVTKTHTTQKPNTYRLKAMMLW